MHFHDTCIGEEWVDRKLFDTCNSGKNEKSDVHNMYVRFEYHWIFQFLFLNLRTRKLFQILEQSK